MAKTISKSLKLYAVLCLGCFGLFASVSSLSLKTSSYIKLTSSNHHSLTEFNKNEFTDNEIQTLLTNKWKNFVDYFIPLLEKKIEQNQNNVLKSLYFTELKNYFEKIKSENSSFSSALNYFFNDAYKNSGNVDRAEFEKQPVSNTAVVPGVPGVGAPAAAGAEGSGVFNDLLSSLANILGTGVEALESIASAAVGTSSTASAQQEQKADKDLYSKNVSFIETLIHEPISNYKKVNVRLLQERKFPNRNKSFSEFELYVPKSPSEQINETNIKSKHSDIKFYFNSDNVNHDFGTLSNVEKANSIFAYFEELEQKAEDIFLNDTEIESSTNDNFLSFEIKDGHVNITVKKPDGYSEWSEYIKTRVAANLVTFDLGFNNKFFKNSIAIKNSSNYTRIASNSYYEQYPSINPILKTNQEVNGSIAASELNNKTYYWNPFDFRTQLIIDNQVGLENLTIKLKDPFIIKNGSFIKEAKLVKYDNKPFAFKKELSNLLLKQYFANFYASFISNRPMTYENLNEVWALDDLTDLVTKLNNLLANKDFVRDMDQFLDSYQLDVPVNEYDLDLNSSYTKYVNSRFENELKSFLIEKINTYIETGFYGISNSYYKLNADLTRQVKQNKEKIDAALSAINLDPKNFELALDYLKDQIEKLDININNKSNLVNNFAEVKTNISNIERQYSNITKTIRNLNLNGEANKDLANPNIAVASFNALSTKIERNTYLGLYIPLAFASLAFVGLGGIASYRIIKAKKENKKINPKNKKQ